MGPHRMKCLRERYTKPKKGLTFSASPQKFHQFLPFLFSNGTQQSTRETLDFVPTEIITGKGTREKEKKDWVDLKKPKSNPKARENSNLFLFIR